MTENRTKQLQYIIHFTKEPVIQSEKYSEWMDMFGTECTHIILNGSGPCIPVDQKCYFLHNIWNFIDPKLFPKTLSSDFDGQVNQVNKLIK